MTAGKEKTAETRLFHYLRDIVFEEDAGRLEIGELPEALQELGEGLQLLGVWMKEVKQLSRALSDGDLDAEFPSADNPLADSLKALHATMKHITWQAQQISRGDYSQKVDYLGDFSEAFNSMTRQLADRELRLAQSRDNALRATALFQKVTDSFGNYVLAVEEDTQEVLYKNAAFRKLEQTAPEAAEVFRKRVQKETARLDGIGGTWEFSAPGDSARPEELQRGYENRHFQVETQFLLWEERQAAVHIIEDVSDEKRKFVQMENLAYFDELTGLHNRSYIMDELESWLKGDFPFCLAFIDLDNLKFANDQIGHAEGDQYIRQAAELISEKKEGRRSARIGGDEFLLLARDCSCEALREELEAKRNAFLQQSKAEGALYRKSFSYGVVEADSMGKRYRSTLLREADRRMYQYKLSRKPKLQKER